MSKSKPKRRIDPVSATETHKPKVAMMKPPAAGATGLRKYPKIKNEPKTRTNAVNPPRPPAMTAGTPSHTAPKPSPKTKAATYNQVPEKDLRPRNTTPISCNNPKNKRAFFGAQLDNTQAQANKTPNTAPIEETIKANPNARALLKALNIAQPSSIWNIAPAKTPEKA